MTDPVTPRESANDFDNDEAHGPLRIPLLVSSGPELKPAIRRKALIRIAILVIVINQLMTTAFAFVVRRSHPDVALGLTTLFSFALCVILSIWIRSDAKYAYEAACKQGYVSRLAGRARDVRIARECPRRWLVVLYVELQGSAVVS
jgi:hypothetical protein